MALERDVHGRCPGKPGVFIAVCCRGSSQPRAEKRAHVPHQLVMLRAALRRYAWQAQLVILSLPSEALRFCSAYSDLFCNLMQIPTNGQGFRHAILHDFCMAIPYGAVVLAAGLVSLLFGSGTKGLSFALGGASILAAAFFSLLQWRQQRPSTVFTLASAGNFMPPIAERVVMLSSSV